MAGRLIVISGPSGSGKSSIVRELLDRLELVFSVSATTRLPRPGERHGVHYEFVSRKDFDAMVENGEFLEWAEYNNRLYGTPALPLDAALEQDKDVLLEIEAQGARQVRENRPDAEMFFIAPPSLEELERRLRRRGDTSEADIEDRLRIAEAEMVEAPELFDHIIINEDLHKAIEETLKLVTR